jgi:hypothetical protein
VATNPHAAGYNRIMNFGILPTTGQADKRTIRPLLLKMRARQSRNAYSIKKLLKTATESINNSISTVTGRNPKKSYNLLIISKTAVENSDKYSIVKTLVKENINKQQPKNSNLEQKQNQHRRKYKYLT